MKTKLQIAFLVIAAGLFFSFSGTHSQTGTGTAPSSTGHKKAVKTQRSSEEIADAKAKGLVWVNLATRVYHKEGPLYGKTKLGKFMREEDAKKAGYRIASENGKESTALK